MKHIRVMTPKEETYGLLLAQDTTGEDKAALLETLTQLQPILQQLKSKNS